MLLLLLACTASTPDTGGADGGSQDGGVLDGGGEDSGGEDSGGEDAGSEDGGSASSQLPSGPFTQLSMGGFHGCALDAEGGMRCWGEDGNGQASPPDGTWVAVAAGLTHSCALDSDGQLHCWGDDSYGQASPPAGSGYQVVSAGMTHSCAIDADDLAVCWGSDLLGQSTVPELGPVTDISAGGTLTAAVQADGGLQCWGNELYCFTGPLVDIVQTSVGMQHVMARHSNGTVACAGFQGEGRCPEPSEVVDTITAGAYQSCGLQGEHLVCWPQRDGQDPPWPDGSFQAVSAGLLASCALDLDGELHCWTWDGSGLDW